MLIFIYLKLIFNRYKLRKLIYTWFYFYFHDKLLKNLIVKCNIEKAFPS